MLRYVTLIIAAVENQNYHILIFFDDYVDLFARLKSLFSFMIVGYRCVDIFYNISFGTPS